MAKPWWTSLDVSTVETEYPRANGSAFVTWHSHFSLSVVNLPTTWAGSKNKYFKNFPALPFFPFSHTHPGSSSIVQDSPLSSRIRLSLSFLSDFLEDYMLAAVLVPLVSLDEFCFYFLFFCFVRDFPTSLHELTDTAGASTFSKLTVYKGSVNSQECFRWVETSLSF